MIGQDVMARNYHDGDNGTEIEKTGPLSYMIQMKSGLCGKDILINC